MRAATFSSLNFLHPIFKKIYLKRLRVLAYHTVPDQAKFERQIIYLKKEYNIISVEDLLKSVHEKSPLPNNPLLITFDDGDVSVYDKGLPILKKYDLKSCLFIITGLVNTTKDVWIRRVEAGEINAGKSFFEARKTVRRLKRVENHERLQAVKNYPDVQKPQLSTEQLYELQDNGMYIGNHTHTHPMLDQCTAAEVQEELDLSKKVFKDLGLEGFNVFAYPNGNEDPSTKKVLEKNDNKLVFLFDHKINPKKINPLYISRIKVDTDMEINEFIAKVSGVHPFLFNIKNNGNIRN